MLKRLLSPHKRQYSHYARLGVTPHTQVWVRRGLRPAGLACARSVLNTAEQDYQRVLALFSFPTPVTVRYVVDALNGATDGTGGAFHWGCSGTDLYADVDYTHWQRTAALCIAELAEVFMDALGNGWDCGDTNGEGLSRVIAEGAYPGALADYSVASEWVGAGMPDWLSKQAGTDTDPVSNGCSVVFLWWLVAQGYALAEIIQAGGSTLAQTWAKLGNTADPYPMLVAAVRRRYPDLANVTSDTDNIWV